MGLLFSLLAPCMVEMPHLNLGLGKVRALYINHLTQLRGLLPKCGNDNKRKSHNLRVIFTLLLGPALKARICPF